MNHSNGDAWELANGDVLASASGTVLRARSGWNGGWGEYVLLQHSDGWQTFYTHLSTGSIAVSEGQSVRMGDLLGRMGTTGNIEGVHLHYEQIYNDRAQHVEFNGSSIEYVYFYNGSPYVSNNCPQPPPTGADRELIRRPSGKVYVMAGGAALRFFDPEAFEETNYSWDDVINVSEEYFDGLRRYPNDQTVLKNHDNANYFVVAGRAPLKMYGPSSLKATREHSGRKVVVADRRAIANLPDYPVDRTVVKRHNGTTHYVVAGRSPLTMYGLSALKKIKESSGRKTVVADAQAIANLPDYPTDRTILRNHSNATHYVVGGRAPLAIHDSAALSAIQGSSSRPTVMADRRAIANLPDYPTGTTLLKDHDGDDRHVVAGRAPLRVEDMAAFEAIREASGRKAVVADARAINNLPDYPNDRTLLKDHDGDARYVVAGRAPLYIEDMAAFKAIRKASGRTSVVADRRTIDKLPQQPVEGTEVEGHPSGDYWTFRSDSSLASSSATEAAVLVDDRALEQFPSAGSDGSGGSGADSNGDSGSDPESETVAQARGIEGACPPEDVDGAGYDDVDGGVHEPGIECVTWWGVAQGLGGGLYGPREPVTRAQMATFVARLLRASGSELPTAAEDHFGDDDGSVHEDNINALAEAGIVAGIAEDSYAPGGPVTRAQMAAFLVRAYEYRADQPLPADGDYFDDDDGSVHEDDINAAATAGLTGGTEVAGEYAPGVTLTRDQMATFLGRLLDLAVEEGLASPA